MTSGSHHRLSADVEVIVVGGGPAGSVIATLLAERGHEVLLLDKARFPRHKACSEYVNLEGVRLLDEIGAGEAIRAARPHRMERMLVHAPGGQVFSADFSAAAPGRTALDLSRHRLDHILLQRAAEAGATIHEHAHVRAVLRNQDRDAASGVEATIQGERETIRARLIVGADGRHSVVRRSLDLDRPVRWPRRTGLVAHYRGATGLDDHGELHVVRHGYAGLAPLEEGLTNVALVTAVDLVGKRSESLTTFFENGLSRIPAVAERLAGATRVGQIRGVGPMACSSRRVAGDGYLLIGDAAGFLDPFTGEGIYEAVLAASLAAPIASAALLARDTSTRALQPYVTRRRRALTAKRYVCSIVQGFVHVPALMDYVTARLDRRPALARTLTGVLADVEPAHLALSPLFLARLLRP